MFVDLLTRGLACPRARACEGRVRRWRAAQRRARSGAVSCAGAAAAQQRGPRALVLAIQNAHNDIHKLYNRPKRRKGPPGARDGRDLPDPHLAAPFFWEPSESDSLSESLSDSLPEPLPDDEEELLLELELELLLLPLSSPLSDSELVFSSPSSSSLLGAAQKRDAIFGDRRLRRADQELCARAKALPLLQAKAWKEGE